jgi:transposase
VISQLRGIPVAGIAVVATADMHNSCQAASRCRGSVTGQGTVRVTLRDHRELLLNWFRARGQLAMGAVEGMNNKARVTTKLAYGFRSYELGEIVLFHRLGNLPEPDWLTHRFT